MASAPLEPFVEFVLGLHLIFDVIREHVEEVDARSALHLVDGAALLSPGLVGAVVAEDESYGKRGGVGAINDFEKS